MSEPENRTRVYLLDDEESLQRALLRLMRSAGFKASAYGCVDDFLATDIDKDAACVIADVHMAGENSLNLPDQLKQRNVELPVIFITAYDSAVTRDKVRRKGAAGYFRKPVDDQALIDAVRWAVREQP